MRISFRSNVICAAIVVLFFCAAAILAHAAHLLWPRTLPQIIVTVTNVSDNVDGDTSSVQALLANPGPDGTISLREALLAANNTGGTDTITIAFAQALAGQSIFPRQTMFINRDGITILGFVDNTRQPAVTIDASQLTDPFVLLDTASNVAVRFLRFVNIQESTGLTFINVNVQPSRPQIGNITIDGNVFSNPPGLTTQSVAVFVNMFPGTTGAVVSNITVTDNSFTHFEGNSDGVLIGADQTNNTIQDTLIAGNTFSDTTYAVELVATNANGSRIIRSRIMGNSFATSIQTVNLNHFGTDGQPPSTGNLIDDTIITGNRFTNNSGPAIVLLGGMTNATANTISNTQIVNNTITGTTQYGSISVVGGRAGGTQNVIQGVAIVNDTIANVDEGGIAVNANIDTSGNTVSGVSVSNTILWSNANGPDFFGVDPSQVQYSITAQSGYFGINHNINADPLFVNSAADDFHLQSGSPARHAGTSNGAPATDLDCQPRGSPPSIGAYEFDGPNICTPTPTPPIASSYDFNHDNKPDYVLYNGGTGQTAVWYMHNNVLAGGDFGPTLPAGWNAIDVADFNRDGNNDYALFNSSTGQTAIWYLSGPTLIAGAYGPSIPSGWELVAVADFNGDSYPDYALYNAGTHQTGIWYLNNNVYVGGGYGPTLPAGWSLVGVADFDRDGHPDYALFNPGIGQTAIWYLSGLTLLGGAYGPSVPNGWQLVATADFNGDDYPDYVLYAAGTRQTAIWFLNNNVYAGGAYGPTVPAGWSLVAP